MSVVGNVLSGANDETGLVKNEIRTENFQYTNEETYQSTVKEVNNDINTREKTYVKQDECKMSKYQVEHETEVEEFLQVLLEGARVPLDTQVSMNVQPPWMDAELLRKGRGFGLKYLFGIVYAQMLALAILFSFRGGLEPLIFTGKSGTPFTAFQRYLSTVTRVVSWYQSDIFEEDSEAYKNMAAVRTMHDSVSKRMNGASTEDLKSKVHMEGKEMWCTHLQALKRDVEEVKSDDLHCPFLKISSLTQKDCPESGKVIYVNQLDLALTQFGFVGLSILYPRQFGLHGATEEELKGFVHLWKCLGYQLGIKDRYNICSSENLEVTRAKCRAVIEKWAKPALLDVTAEWEHMFRCVVEGISYYVPGNCFSVAIAYLLWVLNVPFPNLMNKMTWTEKMLYYAHRFVLTFMTRIPGYLQFSNFLLQRSIRMARNPSAEWLREKREKTYDYQKMATTTVETGS